MLRIVSFDIVFQEVPNEVTLALNISGCPHRCEGCHSSHLWEDTGEELTQELLQGLLQQHKYAATCVCFMGGDQAPEQVMQLCRTVKTYNLKTAWYSGFQTLPKGLDISDLDYLKLGPYVAAKGGLKSPLTNQRLYRKTGNTDNGWEDITAVFWKK
ncbi:MAG: anaerobic ribonucleoside-triphosphate reductase activating protein [Paludibacteraceae bacterium]|nr:anaerobic ribonucleoside-triphosphate reductase activating protein [Paludibacteraceae bacterium]